MRKRYERPCRQIDGNSNPHCGGFDENQSYRVLTMHQAFSPQETNWWDSSGNSPVKILASRCVCKKNRRTKSWLTWPDVCTVTGRKMIWSVYLCRTDDNDTSLFWPHFFHIRFFRSMCFFHRAWGWSFPNCCVCIWLTDRWKKIFFSTANTHSACAFNQILLSSSRIVWDVSDRSFLVASRIAVGGHVGWCSRGTWL